MLCPTTPFYCILNNPRTATRDIAVGSCPHSLVHTAVYAHTESYLRNLNGKGQHYATVQSLAQGVVAAHDTVAKQMELDTLSLKALLSKETIFDLAVSVTSRHLRALVRAGQDDPGFKGSRTAEYITGFIKDGERFWSVSDLVRRVHDAHYVTQRQT